MDKNKTTGVVVFSDPEILYRHWDMIDLYDLAVRCMRRSLDSAQIPTSAKNEEVEEKEDE